MPTTPTAPTEDPVAAGQRALAAASWREAREHFERALEAGASAAAWEGLSWAAWWLSDADALFTARERAYRAHREAGDVERAATMAVWLGSDHLDFRGDHAIGGGWLQRARRMLDGRAPCEAHGWLLLLEAEVAMLWDGDPVEASRLSREAVELGRALGVADFEAVGLAREGATLVTRGEVDEGSRLLDEAAAIAMDEDFALALTPGWTLCILVSVCDQVGDLPRATQWCEAMSDLAGRWHARHFLGACRSAYGSVLATGGEWERAERELTAAVADLRAARPGLASAGLVRLGELRRRQGRAAEARELFEQALPADGGLVGLGRLHLDEGDARSAADCAERVLRRLSASAIVDRVPALELLARARCALGDATGAEAAADELRETVLEAETPYLQGRAFLVAAELHAAAGDDERARCCFEDALDRFVAAAAVYDAAHARAGLARALRRLGRDEAARREARAAADTLERLGAERDLAEARAALDESATGAGAGTARTAAGAGRDGGPAGELTARELEVLRLVAEGCSDAEIAERLVLSPHTVHRHVANVRVKLRQPSRAAAVAYAAREGLL